MPIDGCIRNYGLEFLLSLSNCRLLHDGANKVKIIPHQIAETLMTTQGCIHLYYNSMIHFFFLCEICNVCTFVNKSHFDPYNSWYCWLVIILIRTVLISIDIHCIYCFKSLFLEVFLLFVYVIMNICVSWPCKNKTICLLVFEQCHHLTWSKRS